MNARRSCFSVFLKMCVKTDSWTIGTEGHEDL